VLARGRQTKHHAKRWQVTVHEFLDEQGKRVIKVTRRIPELHVSETRFFRSKKKAQQKIKEWLL
jgi:hypothetical protein